jgi:hypothetical protein
MGGLTLAHNGMLIDMSPYTPQNNKKPGITPGLLFTTVDVMQVFFQQSWQDRF